MTSECDRLSMELVHTCPGWPQCGFQKGLWVRLRCEFRQKLSSESHLIRWTETHRTPGYTHVNAASDCAFQENPTNFLLLISKVIMAGCRQNWTDDLFHLPWQSVILFFSILCPVFFRRVLVAVLQIFKPSGMLMCWPSVLLVSLWMLQVGGSCDEGFIGS